MLADRARDCEHVAQVRGAVLVRRRADGDDLEQPVGNGSLGVRGEGKAALASIQRDQLIEAGLVDRHLAGVQARDLGGIDVDADDVIAGIRQAGAGDKADVS